MEFFGLLGEKLSHSLSPQIHSELLKLMNKDGAYKLFEVEKEKLKGDTRNETMYGFRKSAPQTCKNYRTDTGNRQNDRRGYSLRGYSITDQRRKIRAQ